MPLRFPRWYRWLFAATAAAVALTLTAWADDLSRLPTARPRRPVGGYSQLTPQDAARPEGRRPSQLSGNSSDPAVSTAPSLLAPEPSRNLRTPPQRPGALTRLDRYPLQSGGRAPSRAAPLSQLGPSIRTPGAPSYLRPQRRPSLPARPSLPVYQAQPRGAPPAFGAPTRQQTVSASTPPAESWQTPARDNPSAAHFPPLRRPLPSPTTSLRKPAVGQSLPRGAPLAAPGSRPATVPRPRASTPPPSTSPRAPSGALEPVPAGPAASESEPGKQPLTLREAILAALQSSPLIRTLNGSRVSIDSSTHYDPAIDSEAIASNAGRFDPRLSAKTFGGQINQPPNSFFGPGITTQNRRDEIEFSAKLEKEWATGTTTSVAYEPPLAYLFLPGGSGGGFNPLNSSNLVFELKQSLLRGRGRDVNLAPIRIAQVQAGQTAWQVQEAIQSQLRSVEEAYWGLHAALVTLKAVDRALPLARKNVQIEKLRYREEQVTYADVARATVNLEDLRKRRTGAYLEVQQRDYQLRQLIGRAPEAARFLTPVDTPIRNRPSIDMQQVVAVALKQRPDLQRRRLAVVAQQQKLVLARNNRLPEVNARGLYRASGLSSTLGDSLHQLSDFRFTDWGVGLELSMPLTNVKANAEYRAAELELSRERLRVRGFERQAVFELANLAAEVEAEHQRFRASLRQVEHARKWLEVARIRYERPPFERRGKDSLLLALVDYQQAIDAQIDAVSAAAEGLAAYNSALARLAEAQGTMFQRWEIETAPFVPCGP